VSEKTSKVMLINVTHAEESRVAILSGGVLDAFEIETVDRRSRKGDIYTGRVESVQPALQAAFVDIGDERAAFLPLDEVNFTVYPSRKEGAKGRIEHHLQRGQQVLVQIVRDAYANKPPTLSTYYSLPGRFLVLTPGHSSAGVSRKLGDKEREKIRLTLDDLKPPEPHGLIVRTAAGGATKQDLKRDLRYLLRLWEQIEQAANQAGSRKLVFKERSMVIRAMRDLFTQDIEEILVDDNRTYEEILEFMTLAAPTRKKIVKLYQGQRPIFNKYNLEEQIEHIFRRRVPLEAGGAIIFDPTEALTAIDVNSGKMKKEGHIEDTALKANIEAAREIARQLRLRDLGGLIVIDFIDMRSQKNVREVERVMRDALKRDKAKHDVTRLSRLGLMEISRERVGTQKASLRYKDCPHCAGTGSIKTVEAAALQALRRIQTRIVRGDLEEIGIELPVDVVDYLQNHKRAEICAWEQRYDVRVEIVGNAQLGRDDSEMTTVARHETAEDKALVAPPTEDQIISEFDQEEEAADAADEVEDAGEEGVQAEGGEQKRKRRRRRRRRRSDDAEARGESEAPVDAGVAEEEVAAEVSAEEPKEEEEGGEGQRRKRRRRRRRRRSPAGEGGGEGTEGEPEPEPGRPAAASVPAEAQPAPLAAGVITGATPAEQDGPTPRFAWWRRLIGEAN
jgi:ribonuclease E